MRLFRSSRTESTSAPHQVQLHHTQHSPWRMALVQIASAFAFLGVYTFFRALLQDSGSYADIALSVVATVAWLLLAIKFQLISNSSQQPGAGQGSIASIFAAEFVAALLSLLCLAVLLENKVNVYWLKWIVLGAVLLAAVAVVFRPKNRPDPPR